jgi:hypothetical protein
MERLGEERSVAVILLIGRYVAHGFIGNSIGLTAPVPPVFDAPGQDEAGLGEPELEVQAGGAVGSVF